MEDRYVKPDDNKKIISMDATNFYGHSMSQVLPYDEIEMWHGHPDLYMNKLQEILNTPDDSDIGQFVEVHLNSSDNIKKKQRVFHFVQRIRKLILIDIMII